MLDIDADKHDELIHKLPEICRGMTTTGASGLYEFDHSPVSIKFHKENSLVEARTRIITSSMLSTASTLLNSCANLTAIYCPRCVKRRLKERLTSRAAW